MPAGIRISWVKQRFLYLGLKFLFCYQHSISHFVCVNTIVKEDQCILQQTSDLATLFFCDISLYTCNKCEIK